MKECWAGRWIGGLGIGLECDPVGWGIDGRRAEEVEAGGVGVGRWVGEWAQGLKGDLGCSLGLGK